jgi:hypothetical protein
MSNHTRELTAQWLDNLQEGDVIYLSDHPDSLPSTVVKIDRAVPSVLVAPRGAHPAALGMPMLFTGDELDAIAAVPQ